MVKNIVLTIQIIIAVVLITLIVIQSKGAGLSSAIMGGASTYSTKRGVEKVVFYLTIAAAVVFFIASIILVAIK